MKIGVVDLYKKSSQVALLIYLPFTFFIWYLMLNGFGGGVTSLLVVFVVLHTLFFLKYQKIDVNFLFFSLAMLYCIIYIIFYYVFKGDLIDKSGRSLFFYHLIGVVLYCVSYLIGRNFVKMNDKFYIFIFIIMFFQVVLSADLILFSIDLSAVNESLKGLYLGLSDIFCIFSLLLVGILKKEYWKLIVFILSILALFILNSRASLYIYVFSSLIYFLLFFRVSAIFYLFLFFTLFSFFYLPKINELFLENNRMFAFLAFDGSDQSSQERNLLLNNGINQIFENLFFGDYGGVIRIYNDMGAYIHNILSYWQNYGFLLFLLCLYFMLVQPIRSSFWVFKYRNIQEYHYIFILSVYLCITILFARSYNWYFAWFIVGLVHQFLFDRKKYFNRADNEVVVV